MREQFNFNTDLNTVSSWLDTLRERKERVRVWYGDTKTGLSWNEEHDVIGYIGRSTGTQKIPLLINNSRSMGGPALLVDCIIRIDIVKTKQTVFKHENFHTGLQLQSSYVYQVKNGMPELFASFASIDKAANYLKFMEGERYSK